jgi:hypothetical protein
VFVILISIVTLGIYHLYWVFKTCEEMKKHRGEGIGGIIALLIQFVFAPINWFVIPSEVGKTYKDDGRDAPLTGWTGAWMFLPLIGFIIWVVRVQGGLNRYWASKQDVQAPPAGELTGAEAAPEQLQADPTAETEPAAEAVAATEQPAVEPPAASEPEPPTSEPPAS